MPRTSDSTLCRRLLKELSERARSAYVGHRMAVAGGRRHVFDDGALCVVYRLSSRVPRVINTLCARVLMSAVARRRLRVDRSIVRAAARTAPAPAGSPPIERIAEAPRAEPLTAPPKPARAPAQRARRSRAHPPRIKRGADARERCRPRAHRAGRHRADPGGPACEAAVRVR